FRCCLCSLLSNASVLRFSFPLPPASSVFFFFFNHPPTSEIYTLSLHDALPIFILRSRRAGAAAGSGLLDDDGPGLVLVTRREFRSEEHTSELQSQSNLVCRLLLEKKKKKKNTHIQRKTHTHYATNTNHESRDTT